MSKHPDEFGDRMKDYEGREAKDKFLPMLPIIARIDGRTFSKFTKPFQRPFDQRLANAMRYTTERLVKDSHACIGYTQSDEITLVFHAETYDSQIFFGGRKQKLCSVLAGMTTAFFIRELDTQLGASAIEDNLVDQLADATPHFDCRVWQVPNKTEAANTLLWRAQDARKNGISATCRSLYSAKAMHGKGQKDMVEMIAERGVDYYKDVAMADRLGTFLQRKTFQQPMDSDLWDRIKDFPTAPETNMVTRSEIVDLELGYFGDYVNREAIIFDGQTGIHIDDMSTAKS